MIARTTTGLLGRSMRIDGALMRRASAAMTRLWKASSRRATLAQLEALDDRTLADIGLTRHALHAAAALGRMPAALMSEPEGGSAS